MQEEIEGAEVWQFEAFHLAFTDFAEVFFYARRAHFACEQRIPLFTQSDQSDIGRIAFVARTRMRELRQVHFQGLVFLFVLRFDHFDVRDNLALRNQRRPIRHDLFHFWAASGKTRHGWRSG